MFGWYRKLKRKTKEEKGFTLMELMVVIAIIGILAVVIAPKFGDYTDKAKVARAKAELTQLQTAAELYQLDNGEFPDQISDLQNYGIENSAPQDPWGNTYLIDPGNERVYSNGGTTTGEVYVDSTL